jgi:hypothetical protein
MKPHITPIEVPVGSNIAKQLQGAYFFDSYEMPLAHAGRSALEIYLGMIGKTPSWVNFLMGMRNRVVMLFGLKNLGGLGSIRQDKAATEYRIGDRVGIFTLLSNTDEEVIMGDSDKHLDVKLSICKRAHGGTQSVATTTVVHTHNLLGRTYMFFVIPFHKRIVPATLARAGR